MMIFDGFLSDRGLAERFAAKHAGALVVDSWEECQKHDPFPFHLTPPIVLIPRADEATEDETRRHAGKFGGHYAGT